jgi:hypothetical protein
LRDSPCLARHLGRSYAPLAGRMAGRLHRRSVVTSCSRTSELARSKILRWFWKLRLRPAGTGLEGYASMAWAILSQKGTLWKAM